MEVRVGENSTEAKEPAPPKIYNFRKKKCQYGKGRKKNSKTQREYDEAMVSNPDNPASDNEMEVKEEPEPPAIVIAAPPANSKRKRDDANWRTARHVGIRDKQLATEKKKRVDDQKLAANKLKKEKKKRRTAEDKLKKEKDKRMEEKAKAKDDVNNERKMRVSAEKKVCVFQTFYFCVCPNSYTFVYYLIGSCFRRTSQGGRASNVEGEASQPVVA